MKFHRLLLTALLAVLLSLSAASAVSASSDIKIFVDGIELKMDVPPQILGGRTMVPVRAVSEAVGCSVEWEGSQSCVMVYSPDHCPDGPYLVMYIDNPVVNVYQNSETPGQPISKPVTIDVPPVIVNDRTLVPLRFIAEALGFVVDWDANTSTVNISSATGVGLVSEKKEPNEYERLLADAGKDDLLLVYYGPSREILLLADAPLVDIVSEQGGNEILLVNVSGEEIFVSYDEILYDSDMDIMELWNSSRPPGQAILLISLYSEGIPNRELNIYKRTGGSWDWIARHVLSDSGNTYSRPVFVKKGN
jgi:hypothetical protein